MFNIFSWQHIIILLVIALVVVGPKDLPRLMRMTASTVRKGRSLLQGLSKSFTEMTGTEELNQLRAEMNALKRKHPLSSLQAALNETPPRG
ncbi:MAG TPA: Sec-independent protein translocase protein TatB [Rhizomicrobium sp.]|nr:Sec-independent protein translocase protein TatB [Rhizomicrobium sp.]